jgi:molybdenum cofactor biosynthesis enzyme MoaA
VARDIGAAGAAHVRLTTDEPWLRRLARALR